MSPWCFAMWLAAGRRKMQFFIVLTPQDLARHKPNQRIRAKPASCSTYAIPMGVYCYRSVPVVLYQPVSGSAILSVSSFPSLAVCPDYYSFGLSPAVCWCSHHFTWARPLVWQLNFHCVARCLSRPAPRRSATGIPHVPSRVKCFLGILLCMA